MIEPSSNFQALVRAGSIKAFAVTSKFYYGARNSDRG
jgi:hypothetical protein